jgi:beta-fructofuranosidase
LKALEKARAAIEASSASIAPNYRHRYHAMPPSGWMNDPNGLCLFRGEYHLFYQHNPFAPRWGKMHWGHCVTKDFLRWEDRPVALAPDRRYESILGCFSGSALAIGNEIRVLYTGVGLGGQLQCAARSRDGVDFVKDEANPVIGRALLPRGRSALRFRDPGLFVRAGVVYCLVGSSRSSTLGYARRGELLLYRSVDLAAWSYVGSAYSCLDSPMLECPALSSLSGRDLLVFSPTRLARRGDEFQNLH